MTIGRGIMFKLSLVGVFSMLDCGCWLPGNSQKTVDVQLQHYFETIPNTMFTAFRCFTGECVNDQGLWFCNWWHLTLLVNSGETVSVLLCHLVHNVRRTLNHFNSCWRVWCGLCPGICCKCLGKEPAASISIGYGSLGPRVISTHWVGLWKQMESTALTTALPLLLQEHQPSRGLDLTASQPDEAICWWQWEFSMWSLRSTLFGLAALKCLWIYEHFEM